MSTTYWTGNLYFVDRRNGVVFPLFLLEALNKRKDSESIRKKSATSRNLPKRDNQHCVLKKSERKGDICIPIWYIYIGINTRRGTAAAASHWLSDTVQAKSTKYIYLIMMKQATFYKGQTGWELVENTKRRWRSWHISPKGQWHI